MIHAGGRGAEPWISGTQWYDRRRAEARSRQGVSGSGNTRDRRAVLKWVAGALGATACPLDRVAALAQSAETNFGRPNIICFLGEGLRADESSFAGNKILQTPNIDRIAKEGCAFRNAFVVNALCLPSRATILTGLYSHTTGAVSNVEGKLPPDTRLITDMLHDAGYEMAFLGKAHIDGALMDHYWDYYFGFVGQADYYRPVITEGIRGKYSPAKLYEGEYVDDLLTRKAVGWLQQTRDKPFCLFLWFYAPHTPFYRPPDMVNMFNGVPVPVPPTFNEDQGDYPGKPRAVAHADNHVGTSEVFDNDPRSLEELVKDHYVGVEDNDRNIGLVLEELERQGAMDRTAIVLSSDHGFFLGEHHFFDKRLMYEPSIRVPMMIRYPRLIRAGTTSDEMVLNLDLGPTIVELAGLTPLHQMQGESVMPLARGKKVSWREDWLYEYYEYPGWQNIRPCRGVRAKRYKYIHFFIDPQEYELYDLQSDPDEKNNLYGRPGYDQITADLRARLEVLREQTKDTYLYKPTGLPLHDNTSTL
jgi:arylsulfatase A-like enzyme